MALGPEVTEEAGEVVDQSLHPWVFRRSILVYQYQGRTHIGVELPHLSQDQNRSHRRVIVDCMQDKLGKPGEIAKDPGIDKEGLEEVCVRLLEACLLKISVAFSSDVLLTTLRRLEHALYGVEKKLGQEFQLCDALVIRT